VCVCVCMREKKSLEECMGKRQDEKRIRSRRSITTFPISSRRLASCGN
jgi:hypothetical protein